MAKNSIRDFDATSSNNTDIQSVDISEGCSPAGINNAIRELMADIKDVSAGTVALENPSADSLTVTGDLTVDTNTLFVDASADAVGIGVTPEAFGSVFQPVLRVGLGGGIFGSSATNFRVTSNVYYDSAYKYIANGGASQYEQDGGVHLWYTAPSGSANGALTLTERMRIDASGNLLIGTTGLPSSTNKGTALIPASLDRTKLSMSSASTSSGVELVAFRNPNGEVGTIATNASSTSYNTSSDYRLKENVTKITDGIERVKKLNPSRFNFIADADTTVDGFLAHQVSDIVPEAITGGKDAMMDEEYVAKPEVLDDDGNVVTEAVMATRNVPSYQGIDQSKLVPLLTAALQEAVAKIETLEAKVTALENA